MIKEHKTKMPEKYLTCSQRRPMEGDQQKNSLKYNKIKVVNKNGYLAFYSPRMLMRYFMLEAKKAFS